MIEQEYNQIYTNNFLKEDCQCGESEQYELLINHNTVGYYSLKNNFYNEPIGFSYTPYPWSEDWETDEGKLILALIVLLMENNNHKEMLNEIAFERNVEIRKRGWD
ncbi:MAG: hypothetical protein BZ138_08095 [Methanosphaera sp. rholeuAM270]|nr:MAG: hypothetical protein BZ138_08095 [Methanosphaera sp. rholeuAM270]